MANLPLTSHSLIAHCQSAGFTPAEALALFRELVTLGSPYQFEPFQLRRSPWLRALAHWHLRLRERIQAVRSVTDWQAYLQHWGQIFQNGPSAQDDRYKPQGNATAFVRQVWPLLSFGEPSERFDQRCQGVAFEPASGITWKQLEAQVHHPRFLRRLLQEVTEPLPSVPQGFSPQARLQAALRQTGLRSIRWHWSEALSLEEQGALPLMLEEAQMLLAQPLGWEGPILGLAGASGLELVIGDRTESQGHVRLDPEPTGQTLTVDDWGVLAHEWLHSLDATLARDTYQPSRYLTLGLAQNDPTLPTTAPLLQAGQAWWHLVAEVQINPLPPDQSDQLRQELLRWPQRFRASLGESADLDSFLKAQWRAWLDDDWDFQQHASLWTAWLETHLGASTALAQKTAWWLGQELTWIHPLRTPQNPVPQWAQFLQAQAHEVTATHTDARYLASPIELMARSFEAAMGQVHNDAFNPVWRTAFNAIGWIWPLPAERQQQFRAWQQALHCMKPWWALRQAIHAPLGRVVRHHPRRHFTSANRLDSPQSTPNVKTGVPDACFSQAEP